MDTADSLHISSHERDGTIVVCPSGEIDLSQSPTLRQFLHEVLAKQPPAVVIDLSNVPYMDSSGVATLVEAMQQARRYNGRIVLCGLQDKVKSIFEIARLDMVFTIVDTEEEALAA